MEREEFVLWIHNREDSKPPYPPRPLSDGATKPCPVCGQGNWTRDVEGRAVQIPHDYAAHFSPVPV